MTNEERKYLLEETKRAQSSGFEGSVLDVFRNPNILQEFQAQSVLQPTQGSNIQIASTPEEQQQGLSGVPANQMPEAMVFPNVKPNTSFNTQRMTAPINIEKYDNQGHLVKSYDNVPPGIANLPMGPQGGTVIETPSKRQSGGIMQPKGDPWEYKYEDGNYLTRKRGSENWLTAKGTALEAIKSKVYKQPVTTQPQSESTQPSPRPDQKRQSAPAPTKPKVKVETPQVLDRNSPETRSEEFELIPGLNLRPQNPQPTTQESTVPSNRRSLPRFDIGVRPNAAQADNTRTATPELRGPSLNPPKFDELGRPIELRQEEARRAQQRTGEVTPASPNYSPKIEQPKIKDTEPSWTESAEAWVDEKISGAQRLIGRVLPADEESLIEVPTENIIIPKVESKDLPIQETYTELGRYPDRGGRELASFAHTFDNIEGGTYRIGPKVRELYDERGNLREGSQTNISGAAVAHFLRDSDISENQQFAPPSWEIGSSNYEMRNASTEGKLIGYTEAQMKDPERYRMMYRKNEDGTYSVKYKQLKNIGEADAEWAYDLPVSRQHRFSDIDWDRKGKSTGYQALGGRTYYIPLKANAQNISSEGKFDHTSIPVGDPTEFSRFSGGSIILLFKDPKTGREIGVDVSGSKDALRDTGRKLIKQYGLREEDVTVAYHDMGSYSAKPAAKDGKLDYNQWYDYNQYNRGMSGAPLIIANQQAGGVKRYQGGGVRKYQSGSPTEYFEQKPLTSSDFDYTTDRSRGNARFFSDPITREPFPLVNLPAAEVVAQRTPYNQLSNQSLLAGVSQAKPWFEAGNYDMGYKVLKEREEDLQRASFINEFTGIPAMGRTADRVQNDPADLFTFEGGLDMLGFVRPLSAANKGARALARQASPLVKDAGKFLTTQTPLKNTYKLNPRALKENPEMFLYRARPVGQNPDMNMAAQLRAKEAAGEPLTWYQRNLLNPQTNPQMLAREKYYGQWFEKDPSRLDFYINPGTRNFADNDAIEILRTKLPKSEADKLNVSRFNDAKVLSASPETEFILPKQMIESAERFPDKSWQQLIQEDKSFNTPHWLKGYGSNTPKQLPGSGNTFKSEIDWRNWVKYKEDFDNNPDVIQNLLDIERRTKADGTWMKNADGSPFQGTREEFVVEQSDRFKKAYGEGYNEMYRGIQPKANNTVYLNPDFTAATSRFPQGDRAIFGADYDLAKRYVKEINPETGEWFTPDNPTILGANSTTPGMYKLIYPKGKEVKFNAMGDQWNELFLGTPQTKSAFNAVLKEKKDSLRLVEQYLGPKASRDMKKIIANLEESAKTASSKEVVDPNLEKIRKTFPGRVTTDDLAQYISDTDLSSIKLQNVDDGGVGNVDIVNNKKGQYLKSKVGNILLDLDNPNVYKALVPAAIGTGAAAVAGSEPKMKDLGKVSFQNGGLPGEFMYKSQSAGAPLAYDSPTANGYLLPDPNRPELMNTGATEYKMGVDDVTIPTVVNGNYMDPETAYQRYKLTGEKFKPTADPSAYSKFYDEINKLGIMKYKKGGPKKYQAAGPKTPQKSYYSHRDSVDHQADKILQYEQLKGGPGGIPLPSYSDPKYKSMIMDYILPEVDKIMPNASAMEKSEAIDFVFNAGWDKSNNTIKKDPRAYAIQEYYRKFDPSKLDKDGKWAGRKNAPYSFDQEYDSTIGKLSENERRILMNKGRDWYYQNINNPSPGVPSSDYYDTWYGRIWNTNDFSEFNPNNRNLTHPSRRQSGGKKPKYKSPKMY